MSKKKALAWSPVRNIMKSVGAQIVARDAVDLMISFLEEMVKSITTDALKLTRHSKRTKIMRDDIDLVLKMMK
ncbi:MAG TPA: histone-like protein [Candidatus Lokiarchaeia archaeon]|nr:histone-like protein [Candidatus Lokiarchaeia archaeon]